MNEFVSIVCPSLQSVSHFIRVAFDHTKVSICCFLRTISLLHQKRKTTHLVFSFSLNMEICPAVLFNMFQQCNLHAQSQIRKFLHCTLSLLFTIPGRNFQQFLFLNCTSFLLNGTLGSSMFELFL